MKANAYGFGIIEVAKKLNVAGCNFFYVAQFEEGVHLRKRLKSKNIKISVFEGMLYNPKEYEELNLIPVLNNLQQLDDFISYNQNKKKVK